LQGAQCGDAVLTLAVACDSGADGLAGDEVGAELRPRRAARLVEDGGELLAVVTEQVLRLQRGAQQHVLVVPGALSLTGEFGDVEATKPRFEARRQGPKARGVRLESRRFGL